MNSPVNLLVNACRAQVCFTARSVRGTNAARACKFDEQEVARCHSSRHDVVQNSYYVHKQSAEEVNAC